MGVPGLWNVIKPASETVSLPRLAVVEGFEKNISGVRGCRLAIDASLWLVHAQSGSGGGKNPELQVLFSRLADLLRSPILPAFVFDGAKRPSFKRNKQINTTADQPFIESFKTMIAAFGFEYIQAPGEAEAEAAYLNSINVVDAVLSDDVDTFLFGAQTVIRNTGKHLAGNIANPAVNKNGTVDGDHTRIFRLSTIAEKTSLSRGGLILIALLSGGDYHDASIPGSKLPGCGIRTAYALARCGFGDALVNAYQRLTSTDFVVFLKIWREDVREELRTNSQGFLASQEPQLASAVTDDFPNSQILAKYIHPVSSESIALDCGETPTPPVLQWTKDPNLAALARFCQDNFGWTSTTILKKFKWKVWPGTVVRFLRRAQLDLDSDRGKDVRNRLHGVPRLDRPLGGFNPPTLPVNGELPNSRINHNPERPFLALTATTTSRVQNDGIPERSVEVNHHTLVQLTAPRLTLDQNWDKDVTSETMGSPLHVLVPASMLANLEHIIPSSTAQTRLYHYFGPPGPAVPQKTGKGLWTPVNTVPVSSLPTSSQATSRPTTSLSRTDLGAKTRNNPSPSVGPRSGHSKTGAIVDLTNSDDETFEPWAGRLNKTSRTSKPHSSPSHHRSSVASTSRAITPLSHSLPLAVISLSPSPTSRKSSIRIGGREKQNSAHNSTYTGIGVDLGSESEPEDDERGVPAFRTSAAAKPPRAPTSSKTPSIPQSGRTSSSKRKMMNATADTSTARPSTSAVGVSPTGTSLGFPTTKFGDGARGRRGTKSVPMSVARSSVVREVVDLT